MTTSAVQTFNLTRDQLLTRALRIVGAIGQGETPTATAITEATVAFNSVIKELEADGMQLWKVTTYSITPIAGTKTYNIGVGQPTNQSAPLKIIQAWNRNTATKTDSPILILTRFDYNILGNKDTPGTTSQIFYNPPPAIQAGGGNIGVLTMYPTPDANMAASSTLMLTGVASMDDAGATGDTIDFPQFWNNAVTWLVADQLTYEYKVGLSERAMISKKAVDHKTAALGYGTEEGSLKIYPMPGWNWETYQ